MGKKGKIYNSEARYIEKRDKQGNIVSVRFGDKRHYIQFSKKEPDIKIVGAIIKGNEKQN